MQFNLLNLYSALAIGLVICGMAMLPSVRAKALLYVFPIPISIGIIATHGHISGSNLIGLSLVWVFLWLTELFYRRWKLPIVLADALAALIYIGIGYSLSKLIHWKFWIILVAFIAVWSISLIHMRRQPIAEKPAPTSKLPPVAKGSVAGIVSFAIYSVQHVLAGVVVTFPYNGIFAVIEAKHNLRIFSRAVIRNTMAIAGMFTAMYYLQSHLVLATNLVAGWAAFGVVLWLVQRLSV